jgi:hypothetical protein
VGVDRPPALARLALYIGLTRFSLGIEAVEALFEALF